MRIKLPAAAALLALPAIAAEPSFDCANPSSGAEEAVCSSDALAAYDVELDRLYRAAVGGPNLGADRLAELHATQRGWIKGRDACWKVSDLETCVRDEYAMRIYQLRQGYADARVDDGASLGPFPWVCEGLDAALGSVFVNGPEPLVVLNWREIWLVLPIAPSGSGARYADGSAEFWTKGDVATFAPPGGSATDCRLDSMD